MKITYRNVHTVRVLFDQNYVREMQVPYDRPYDTIEDEMWAHRFDSADVYDASTGELLMRLERDI